MLRQLEQAASDSYSGISSFRYDERRTLIVACVFYWGRKMEDHNITLANSTAVEVMTFGSDGTMSVHPAVIKAFLAALPRFVPQTEKPIYREDYSLEDFLKRERYEADLRNEFIDWIMQQFMENQDG